jgi:hypothetical protein
MGLPAVPAFLEAVLASGDRETFFAACWSIRIADGCRDYIRGLADSATPHHLVKWVLAAEDLRSVQAATAALITIAECGYSPAYLRVIPPLLDMVEKSDPAIHHCLNLLEQISQYKETLETFVSANVVGVLAKITAVDLCPYVVQIYRSLKASGLVMPT